MSETKKTVGIGESLLGLFILCLLLTIGIAISVEQQRFHPILQDAAPQGLPEAPPAPASSLEPKETYFSRIDLPDGLKPMSEAEIFDAASLSDKIDGKAELYLGAGFLTLQTRRFALKSEPAAWLEVFIYQMKDPEGAFSVFSLQKRDDAVSIQAGPMSYRTSNALYLTHGPYYLELIAAAENPALGSEMLKFTLAFQSAFPIAGTPLLEMRLFPPEGLDPQSIVLIAADAFGFDRLNKVFTAQYNIDGTTISAFVSRRADPAEADALAAAYQDFLTQFGAQSLQGQVPGHETILVFSAFGEFEVFFSQGVYVAGVHQSADKDKALRLAIKLSNYLKKLNE